MKTSLLLCRLQRAAAFLLALLFFVMCFVCKDEIGISKNPPVQAIIMGLSILIGFVWIIVDALLSMQIEAIKDELADAKSDDEVKQVL
jgi:hypothetical protein